MTTSSAAPIPRRALKWSILLATASVADVRMTARSPEKIRSPRIDETSTGEARSAGLPFLSIQKTYDGSSARTNDARSLASRSPRRARLSASSLAPSGRPIIETRFLVNAASSPPLVRVSTGTTAGVRRRGCPSDARREKKLRAASASPIRRRFAGAEESRAADRKWVASRMSSSNLRGVAAKPK